MKKRWVSLFLCLIMAFSVILTACSSGTEDDARSNISDSASKSATTLTMWMVSEKEVDEKTAKEINNAVNSLTRAKYKVNLIIKYFTADEYYDILKKEISAFEETRKAQMDGSNSGSGSNNGSGSGDETDTGETGTVVEDETERNEYGQVVIKYPEVLANQVDIIFIGSLTDENGNLLISGETMYNELIDNGWLAGLNDELANNSKKISEYVSPTLISAAKKDGIPYAIPNNNVIGEYTYMLLNKTLMDRYSQQGYFKRGMIDSFYNPYIYQYLDLVALQEDNSKVLPIDATYEDCLQYLAYYWNIDPENYTQDGGKFSLFGTYLSDPSKISRGEAIMEIQSLLENDSFRESYLQLNKYRLSAEHKYFKSSEEEDTSGKSVAIKFVSGDKTIVKTEADGFSYYYDKDGTAYYVVPVKYPTASAEDIYGSMIGVCSYSVSVARSMEIVTYLNTNAEIRNLLQYGIKGNNYKLDDDGRVVMLNDSYSMDIYKTGNAFIAYPAPGMNEDIWESGKEQNRMSLVDPLLGFDLKSFAESSASTDEDVKYVIGSEGYLLSYKSGYSKQVLSQNAVLKEWLTACDTAGKDVYIHRTYTTQGTNTVNQYYVYNNKGTGTFSADVTRSTRTEIKNNKEEEILVGLRVDFKYDNIGTDGYGLTIVTLVTPKSLNSNTVVFSSSSSNSSATQSKSYGLIELDYNRTENYAVTCNQLTLPQIAKNEGLFQTVKKWYTEERNDENGNKQQTNFILSYADTTSSTKENYYTYVVFRNQMYCKSDMNLIVNGEGKSLVIDLNFMSDESYVLDPSSETDYLLYYITVTAKKNVKVDPVTIHYNGGDDMYTTKGKTAETATVKVQADKDPDFRIYGDLDTELIKYINTLNAEMIALLESSAAAGNYNNFEKLVNAMAKLLSSQSVASNNAIASSRELQNLVKNGVIKGDFRGLLNRMKQMTHVEKLNILNNIEDTTDNPDDLVIDKKFSEKNVYYSSPYAIYYQWLQAYGYLPQ